MLGRVGAAEAALYEDGPEDDGGGGTVGRVKRILQGAIPRGAVILGVLALVNAGSGFLAKKVVGHFFGAGTDTDAFWNATALTQFPVDVLITGGVIGPFLPLFLGLKGEAEQMAREFARTVLTAALIAMSAAIVLMLIFAPQIASVAAPGFQGDQLNLYIGLIRVVCLGQLAITASLVLGEILIAERRFISYGLAEFALNLGTAGGAAVLGGLFGMGIYGAAIGFLCGAVGHLAVRLVGIYRTTFRPRLSLALRTKGVGEFAVLMVPKMVSFGLLSLLLLYFNQIASTLAPGSTSAIAYARDFQSTAESMVGLSFALAAFAALSSAAAAGDKRTFKKIFRTNALTIGILSTLAAITLAVSAGFISSLFKGGNFDDTDASRMTLVLVVYAFSIPFECLVEILARAIYATRNTSEPMIAVAIGFIAGVGTTMSLSGPIGLAALPLGYVAFQAVRVGALAFFLRPRMARLGGTSRWSRAIVRDRWGAVAPGGRQVTSLGQLALLSLLLISLSGGTAFFAAQALSHATLAGDAQTTPWARVGGTRAPVLTPSPTPFPTLNLPSASASASAQPSGTPGVFSMDLYQPGDFVSEIKDVWCVPAAMQTSMNIMSVTPDTTRDTQAKLFDLAVSLAGSSAGGADPSGWAEGLQSLGYGNYKVDASLKLVDAIHIVAKQIRITERPAGLLVWKGWHSWVVSGFTATADPAVTDNFTVISVYIEDVWYPRVSTLWPKSRPPDANVLVSQLSTDYVPWVQGTYYPGRDGRYVFVEPIE
jgi:putative peptidoglycan lipid II flippase